MFSSVGTDLLATMSTTEYYDYDIIPMTPGVQIPSAIGLTLLTVVAIGGNLMTIVAYLRDRNLNTVYDFYIFNLGITDLLLSSISMPFYVVYTLEEFTWPFGYTFCKVWLVMDFTLCFESIMIMLILSMDRLLMISMASAYMIKVTKRIAVIQITVSWLISFLVYGPAIIGWNHWVGYSTVEENDCDVEFAYDHMYTTVTSIVEFVLPFVCLTFLNGLIYYKIRRLMRVSPKIANRNYTPQGCTQTSDESAETKDQSQIEAITQNLSTNNRDCRVQESIAGKNTLTVQTDGRSSDTRRPSADRTTNKESNINTERQAKAAKFLAMLVIAFLFFWAPYIITTMAISFCDECVNTSLYEFFNWLLWMKSAVNPFLYAYNSPRYRAHFQRYLSCNGRIPIFGKTLKKSQRDKQTRTTIA